VGRGRNVFNQQFLCHPAQFWFRGHKQSLGKETCFFKKILYFLNKKFWFFPMAKKSLPASPQYEWGKKSKT